MKVKSESEVAQSCPTLSDPMDCSLPGSSVHGIFQAKYWSGVPLPSLPGRIDLPNLKRVSDSLQVLQEGFAHSLSYCNFANMLTYCIFRPAIPQLEFVLELSGRLVKTLIAGPGAQEFVFLTSSQMVLMLLGQGPHIENLCLRV